MDMKRFTEIGGQEALERLSNGLDIFNNFGVKFQIDFEKLDYTLETSDKMLYYGEEDVFPVTLIDVLKKTWYVKKPFDVRAEMLARPNEWVAAYRDERGNWCKVRFNSKKMMVQDTVMKYEATVFHTEEDEIEKCIPIEDVPKEEL